MRIAIGGMIASGKSTLVNNLSKTLNIQAMREFEADDIVFNTMLDWLYKGVKDVDMLLQNYFLHHNWSSQRDFKESLIQDKYIIENLIFAQDFLRNDKEQLEIYNGIFNCYVKSSYKPDIYIILQIDWETFKMRINKRGRQQEIENFNNNIDYFKRLIDVYIDKLVEQCKIYNIPYYVLNTIGLNEQETLERSLEIINEVFVAKIK